MTNKYDGRNYDASTEMALDTIYDFGIYCRIHDHLTKEELREKPLSNGALEELFENLCCDLGYDVKEVAEELASIVEANETPSGVLRQELLKSFKEHIIAFMEEPDEV